MRKSVKKVYKQVDSTKFRSDFNKFSKKFKGLRGDFEELKNINKLNPNNKYSKKLQSFKGRKYVRYKTPYMKGKGIRIIAEVTEFVKYEYIAMRDTIYEKFRNWFKKSGKKK